MNYLVYLSSEQVANMQSLWITIAICSTVIVGICLILVAFVVCFIICNKTKAKNVAEGKNELTNAQKDCLNAIAKEHGCVESK